MSIEYDNYLQQHINNVGKGYVWLRENIPDLFTNIVDKFDIDHQITCEHDRSKYLPDEYTAYDKYFYGGNKSYEVTQEFRKAWLEHIHRNPHHWQHWILINDDPNEGEIIMEMPYRYVVEMICDWWAFSWNKGNLNEIFDWYDEHKDYIKLHKNTRKTVESILAKLKVKIEETEFND